MKNCNQTPTQTIWEHGESIADYYLDIINHIKYKTDCKYIWKLPDWIFNEKLILGQYPLELMLEYQIYHDCGKPYCRIVDDCGRQHFPDHARISANIYRAAFNNEQIARLIESDMLIHTIKSSDIEWFKAMPECYSLLLTGLCEVHSNAQMFGGIDSTSFKIKWKNINKIGERLLK